MFDIQNFVEFLTTVVESAKDLAGYHDTTWARCNRKIQKREVSWILRNDPGISFVLPSLTGI